ISGVFSHMSQASRDELAHFIREVSLAGDTVASLPCGRANASFSREFCTPERAAELAQIANRPVSGLTLYKYGSRSIVGSFVLSDGYPVVLKYYYPRGLHKHLSYGIIGSRCHQSWMAALALRYIGIPTPAPLVIVEWNLVGGLWLSKSFLATRQAPGVSLKKWVNAHREDNQRLNKMADKLREVFLRMADYSISHGDLKADN